MSEYIVTNDVFGAKMAQEYDDGGKMEVSIHAGFVEIHIDGELVGHFHRSDADQIPITVGDDE